MHFDSSALVSLHTQQMRLPGTDVLASAAISSVVAAAEGAGADAGAPVAVGGQLMRTLGGTLDKNGFVAFQAAVCCG